MVKSKLMAQIKLMAQLKLIAKTKVEAPILHCWAGADCLFSSYTELKLRFSLVGTYMS